ncbi:hypothetical protein [Tenacibaculum sp. 190524A05c]|uniref:hypothetical protein n=1 Tax=Tenacibaculum platacis TaxID=3137852 RepID=UPI0032B30868
MASTINKSVWMRDVQEKRFKDIAIPGTHDSGTYDLSHELSDIKYSNIAFLWKLSSKHAPVNGKLPFDDKIYLGKYAYDWIMNFVTSVSKAQNQSIFEQLKGGIRYFDLRIYFDHKKQAIYLQHGLRSVSLENVLIDVAKYLNTYQEGKELIFLKFSHSNFSNDIAPQGKKILVDLVSKHLGSEFIHTLGITNFSEKIDLNEVLAETKLKEITGNGSKVVLLNTQTSISYPNYLLKTDGFKSSDRSASGVNTIEDLIKGEQNPLRANKGVNRKLYSISWTFTVKDEDVVNGAINALTETNSDKTILQSLAEKANSGLQKFIDNNQNCNFNLITVDWFETSPVVELCINHSLKNNN